MAAFVSCLIGRSNAVPRIGRADLRTVAMTQFAAFRGHKRGMLVSIQSHERVVEIEVPTTVFVNVPTFDVAAARQLQAATARTVAAATAAALVSALQPSN